MCAYYKYFSRKSDLTLLRVICNPGPLPPSFPSGSLMTRKKVEELIETLEECEGGCCYSNIGQIRAPANSYYSIVTREQGHI